MYTVRIGSVLTLTAGLLLGGCASFNPSPLVLKNHIEPVMRSDGVPMTADQHYQSGRSALMEGNLASARQHFMQTLLHDPKYIDAINGMAAILTVQGRYADSLELMRQATVRDPENEMYRRNLTRVEALARRSEPESISPGKETPEAADARIPVTTTPAVVTLQPASHSASGVASFKDSE